MIRLTDNDLSTLPIYERKKLVSDFVMITSVTDAGVANGCACTMELKLKDGKWDCTPEMGTMLNYTFPTADFEALVEFSPGYEVLTLSQKFDKYKDSGGENYAFHLRKSYV